MKILITGTAGFIGYHIAKRLLEQGNEVVGLDNINDYYDVNLKLSRLVETGIIENKIVYAELIQSQKFSNYRFIKLNLEDRENLQKLFAVEKFDLVCNLAAQAGVRYSIDNPYAYIDSNIVGFINILECCRNNTIKHLIYASSSSVYGNNPKVPFSEEDRIDYPLSLYAATKKANELMAHAYSHLYKLPTTGLRFFTVYGPWGRPDMAPMLFAKSIMNGESIKVFNHGDMQRDFTYIDDIVDGVVKVIDKVPDKNEELPYYRILNIGNSRPIALMDFIRTIEIEIGQRAKIKMYPMQAGDVTITYSDVTKLEKLTGYKPNTDLKIGIKVFINWYKQYELEKI
ncbi:MAG: NAD-dependent epimerase [Paludibacter sp.]|jgi:UDP-glucuronate 4-epimerase